MKKLFLLRKSLFIAFAAATCGLFFTSCGTDVKIPSQSDKENTTTKMTRSEFHWRCPSCGLLNGGWRNYCADPRCCKEYSVPHGNLILTYLDIIKYTVGFATDITTPPDFNQIELPGRIFPAYAPEPWYETTCALKYYNELKNSSTYRLTPSYAEGVEFAWYRTVRILYPKLHDATTVERLFDKFILNEGRNLKGFNGQGIKDASKAAIEAFTTCKKF